MATIKRIWAIDGYYIEVEKFDSTDSHLEDYWYEYRIKKNTELLDTEYALKKALDSLTDIIAAERILSENDDINLGKAAQIYDTVVGEMHKILDGGWRSYDI